MKLVETAIFCDNVSETSAFYERLLGVAPKYTGEGIAIFESEGVEVLIHARFEDVPGEPPCENHVAYAVMDADATCLELAERGLTVEYPPKTYYWGRSAYLRDPTGRLIEIIEQKK